jgi:hypothetical protein
MNPIPVKCGRFLLASLVLSAAASAGQARGQTVAQADVAIVSQISGEASYAGEGQSATKVKPFMRVRQRDRFVIRSGATVRLVYFIGARQETWTRPASFRAGVRAGEPSGAARPEVAILPATVPQKIERVPELIRVARLAGVTLRGASKLAPTVLAREQQAELDAARSNYRLLRVQAAADDLTPELYLFSVLYELGQEDEARILLANMTRRAPESLETQDLAAWLLGRSGVR